VSERLVAHDAIAAQRNEPELQLLAAQRGQDGTL